MCRPILKIYQLCALLSLYTGHLLSDRDTSSSAGMGAGVNGNNQWEWEGNGNKTTLNLGLGMGMGINHWEWEGMGLKKIFQLISSIDSTTLEHSRTLSPLRLRETHPGVNYNGSSGVASCGALGHVPPRLPTI